MGDLYRFDRFKLDLAQRRLSEDGAHVELNGRYLDALALLVREAGSLVTKDRFMDEVWRGIPVTDEALTQCVRSLRRCLGDDAGAPRFIQTVPKHGYRFVAEVKNASTPAPALTGPRGVALLSAVARQAAAGTAGAGLAGLLGGIAYGFVAASAPADGGPGALSVMAVVTVACVLVALLGGAGVASGIALARVTPSGRAAWTLAGGALGGMIVGAAVKLFGLDAFTLLVGRAPADITGPGEGALLGAGVAIGVLLVARFGGSWRRRAALAALPGAAAGLVATLAGGRMMAGSLALLGQTFPGSRLRLDQIGALFGDHGIGRIGGVVTGALEGAIFAVGVVMAMRMGFAGSDDRSG